jgi:hypothetical protein
MVAKGGLEQVLAEALSHLGEVIKSIEEAAHAIMDAADEVQAVAVKVDTPRQKQIMAASTRIYEACGFHDINAQRIQKVIKLLVDEGGGNISNRPLRKEKTTSQAEVDALFAGRRVKKAKKPVRP